MKKNKQLTYLKNLIKELNSKSKKMKIKTGFVISTTTKKSQDNIVFLPIRETKHVICGAATLYNIKTVKSIIKYLDGKIDYFIIDGEQKVKQLSNLVRDVSLYSKKTKVLTFKNNDVAADTADVLISQLIGNFNKKKIAIIGMGNIGSKLALKLVERGMNVFIASSTFGKAKKVANALNTIKPKECKAEILPKDITMIAHNVDLLIGFTPGIPVIDSKMVNQMKRNGILIDGGSGTIYTDVVQDAQKKGIRVMRLDISTGFASAVALSFEMKKFLDKIFEYKNYKGIRMISRGIYGVYGDVIVDNVSNPTQVVGIADGRGKVLHQKLTPLLNQKINVVKQLISNKRTHK